MRALLGLTAGAGAFAAAAAASTGQLPLIGLPTLALLGLLLARAPISWPASAAASVWLLLLPAASGEGDPRAADHARGVHRARHRTRSLALLGRA